MKAQFKKKLNLECTLDSSESIMFTQGSKFSIKLKHSCEEDEVNFDEFDEIELSFQMQRNEQGLFDHITGQAAQHRKQWHGVDKEEGK